MLYAVHRLSLYVLYRFMVVSRSIESCVLTVLPGTPQQETNDISSNVMSICTPVIAHYLSRFEIFHNVIHPTSKRSLYDYS